MNVLKMKLLVFLLAFPTIVMSAEKYLITMLGPKPAIAKSFKSLGDGKYEFVIDSSKKLKGDVAVNFDILKSSLEKKSYVTSVEGDSAKIVVSYKKYDEAKFLKKISKARIKASSGVSLAMEGSVSSGSARARTAQRKPVAGEVKGKILGIKGNQLRVMVQKKGISGVPSSFPMMRPIMVNPGSFKGKTGQVIFFKPTRQKGKIWQGTDFKDK